MCEKQDLCQLCIDVAGFIQKAAGRFPNRNPSLGAICNRRLKMKIALSCLSVLIPVTEPNMPRRREIAFDQSCGLGDFDREGRP